MDGGCVHAAATSTNRGITCPSSAGYIHHLSRCLSEEKRLEARAQVNTEIIKHIHRSEVGGKPIEVR